MRPAGRLDDRSWFAPRVIEPVEPRISVCLHQPYIAGKMLFGMFGAAIGRVEEDHGRRIAACKWPVVAHISPEPPGPGLALGEDRHGGVVGMDALGGEDVRRLPLSLRKTNLARLLARRPDGIFLSDFEQGEIGPDVFVAACRMGLEGLVSKHRDRPYRGGRQKHWIKVKNRKHPAMDRVLESLR
jgi:hypothetical protein